MTFMDLVGTLRRYLLKAALPFTKRLGMMHSPYSHKLIKAKNYREAIDVLKPGDVLLTKTYGELSNVLIPGPYKHGAIYVGNKTVVEAVGAGVKETDLIDFLLEKDEFVICKPLFATDEEMGRAAAYAISQEGAPYDYDFRSDNKAFYCFELTFAAYQVAMNQKSPWDLKVFWGVPTVVSADFLNAKSKWAVVYNSQSVPRG